MCDHQLIIREVNIQRILNPTSIDLGEAVINPYKGCELGCAYCYVQNNRVASKNQGPWGSYVDVRINSCEQLEKELSFKKVSSVLLGSTTECFQPVEKKYQLTRKILEILNEREIPYCILTRSIEILDALPCLVHSLCKKIYFTVNLFDTKFKQVLEPKSPDFEARANAIQKLLDHGLEVITYFSPVLPWISNFEHIFEKFLSSKKIEFEFLNFTLKNIHKIIEKISSVDPEIGKRYKQMQMDKNFFQEIWQEIEAKIEALAHTFRKEIKIYKNPFEGFFENRYSHVSL